MNEDTELFSLVLMPHVCDYNTIKALHCKTTCFPYTVHSLKQASCYHSHSGWVL